MIAILRTTQYQMNRQPVAMLTELHFDDAAFLAGRRAIAQFYVNATQDALMAEALAANGVNWGDREALIIGQAGLDVHADFGGQGLVLQLPPNLPTPAPSP